MISFISFVVSLSLFIVFLSNVQDDEDPETQTRLD